MTVPDRILTLEQQRAKDAWERVERGVTKEYVNAAKAMPALIMNSGLLQVMAFSHQKQGMHEQVASDLRAWLAFRHGGARKDPGFEPFMKSLISASSSDFQSVTVEAFAWLKWLRQLAAAAQKVN